MTKPKVLVVDDEPDLLDVICIELDLRGFETFRAISGNRAIQILHEQEIDAIVSDIRMPDGSGIDILQFLLERQNLTPIIFLSGFSDVSREELFGKGASGFYTKPTEMKIIAATLEKTLLPASQRWTTPSEPTKKVTIKLAFTNYEAAKRSGSFEVGSGGFFINVEAPRFSIGETIEFEIKFGETRALLGEGTVRWLNQTDVAKTLCGIEIDYLMEGSRSTFLNMIDVEQPIAFIPQSSSD